MAQQRGAPSSDPRDGVVYVAGFVGLANRLRALAGYAAMSRTLLGRPARLHWVRDRYCPVEFHDLFAAADVEILSADAVAALPRACIFTGAEWFHDIWSHRLQGTVSWTAYLREVARFLESLKIQPAIADRAREFASRVRLESATGLHIRQTDNVPNYDVLERAAPEFRRARVTDVRGFHELIERRPDRQFFLATDNQAIQRNLVKAFGDRVACFPKRYSAVARLMGRIAPEAVYRPSSVQDALAEMTLLGRCEHVVGTYFSSFGELSAVWGGKEFSIMQGRSIVPSISMNQTVAQMRSQAAGDGGTGDEELRCPRVAM